MQTCRWFLTCAVLLVASVSSVLAQRIDLLEKDGLKNWVKADGHSVDSAKWELSDGVLHLTSGGGGDIFCRNWIGDFELTFEWRISQKGNSGVKYRVQQYGDSWLGCEYQMQDDGTSLLDKHSTASLYDVVEPSSATLPNPAGEWNTSRIVVVGNHIEHWLNGTQVVCVTVGSRDWMSRVCQSKFKDRFGWGQNLHGRLMLQDHGSEVWFRNMHLTCYETFSDYASWDTKSIHEFPANPRGIVCDRVKASCFESSGERGRWFKHSRLFGR